jgi:geranylgeranyl reductase family protein
MRYDVIVVGAGPAGSTTARECAARGLSVVLLDRAEFPRDKPCGGAVTVRALSLLPFDITPVVERTITGVHFTMRQNKGFTRRSSEQLVFLTQRSKIDAYLVERAVEAGVELKEGFQVREIERRPTHVVVRNGVSLVEGTTLVAADGANGVTAKLAGLSVDVKQHIALEGNITPPNGVPDLWQDTIGLDVGGIEGGYGWIFPKGDHLNIGLGGWKHVGSTLRERLDQLVRYYGYDPKDVWGLRGHHLPMRQRGSALADGNVLLVGDAAGLVDPVTDEGIHSAIWSGRAAARRLAEYVAGEAVDLAVYGLEVERDLAPGLVISRQFHDLFHLSPAISMWFERHTSIFWRLTCRILRGEQTYAGVMGKHPFIATVIGFVSDLIRVTPVLRRMAGLREASPPERFFRRRDGGAAYAKLGRGSDLSER